MAAVGDATSQLPSASCDTYASYKIPRCWRLFRTFSEAYRTKIGPLYTWGKAMAVSLEKIECIIRIFGVVIKKTQVVIVTDIENADTSDFCAFCHTRIRSIGKQGYHHTQGSHFCRIG